MGASETLPTQTLLEESAWLRRLARRLVEDPATADDAAQAALIALARRRSADGSSRRWLGSVLRNFLRQGHRASSRRHEREERAAARDHERSAAETAARLEVHRLVIDAVQALEEPYRTAITLRFLEGEPPREVARRMGTPVKTVHTRVDRGLQRLRARLDTARGGRSAWLSALAPFTVRRTWVGPAGLGVIAMNSSIKWAGAALGLVAVGWFLRRALPADEGTLPTLPPGAGATPLETARPESETPSIEDAPGPDRRVALDGGAAEVVEGAASAPPRFEGRVVDVTGQAIGGVTVRFDLTTSRLSSTPPEERTAECDSQGRFEMELFPERGRLVAHGRGYATLVSPGVAGTLPAEPPLVVVGPERSYAGLVLDEEGHGLAGVELMLHLGEDVAATLVPGGLSGVVPVGRTRTGDGGEFALESVGFATGSVLTAELEGYEPRSIDLPPASAPDLVLTLVRTRAGDDTLAGIVLDLAGEPVPDAFVSAGQFTARTDAAGAFVLVHEPRHGNVVRAVAPGYLPRVLPLSELDQRERRQLVLVLGGEALTISGTVVRGDGRPVPDAPVWTPDGDPFGFVSRRTGEMEFMMSKDVEEMIAGTDRDGREERTDAQGRFELDGLAERDYTLFAMHPETLAVARADAVAAGVRGVTLVLGESERTARVAGTVTTTLGVPVEGALVRVGRQLAAPGGGTSYRSAGMEFQAVTDAEGRFAFAELAVEGTRLLLNGEMIPSAQTLALDLAADLEALVFRVPSRCHLRVLLTSDASLATAFELLDQDGERLNLSFMRGSVTLGSAAVGIVDGESPLTQTDDSARTIVLFGADGTEVLRQAIRLRPGEVNEIRL